jgi:hypothetical protein
MFGSCSLHGEMGKAYKTSWIHSGFSRHNLCKSVPYEHVPGYKQQHRTKTNTKNRHSNVNPVWDREHT